jgi:hypothetical protein
MSQNPIDPELNAIAASLGSLEPTRSRIDRDLVMFRAGQASVRPSRLRRRAWNVIAASLALVALGEGALLVHRPSQEVVERLVVGGQPVQVPYVPPVEQSVAAVTESLPSESSLWLGQTAYKRQLVQVLRYGIDGLPASSAVASPGSEPRPASAGQMLQEELRRLRDPGDPS